MGAIVLAGGGGKRLTGTVVKPAVEVAGVPMIDRVLAALHGADPIVVVGPESLDLPAGVTRTRENPPGGGPVAGLGAAMSPGAGTESSPGAGSSAGTTGLGGVFGPRGEPEAVSALAGAPLVAILGGDLPLLRAADLVDLTRALTSDADGAVFVDPDGREQWLCGVWRTASIHARLHEFAAERGGLANGSLRALFGPLRFVGVQTGNTVMPPYFDCDTDDDIRRAEEWLRQ